MDEQTNSSTIFDAYRNLLCAQFAFAQGLVKANADLVTLWSGSARASAKDERPSVAAILPEVMTA